MSRSANARGASKGSAIDNANSAEGAILSSVLDENVRLMQQLRSEFKEMEMLKLVAERRRDVYAIVEEEHVAKLAAVPLPQPVPAGELPADPSTDQLQTALSSLQQLYVQSDAVSPPRSMARALPQQVLSSPAQGDAAAQHATRPPGPHAGLSSPGLSASSSVLGSVQAEVASLEREGVHGSLQDSVRARRHTEGESRRAQALLELTVQQSSHVSQRARASVDRSGALLEQAMHGGYGGYHTTAQGDQEAEQHAAQEELLPQGEALRPPLPPMSPSAWLAEPVLLSGPSRAEASLALTQPPLSSSSAQHAHTQGQAPGRPHGLTFAKALAEAEAARARGEEALLLAPSLAAAQASSQGQGQGGEAQGDPTRQQAQGQAQEGEPAAPPTSSRPKRAAPSAREAQKREILAQLFAAADASAAEEAAQERAVAEARALDGADSASAVQLPLVSSPGRSKVRDVSELRALSRSKSPRAAGASASASSGSGAAPPSSSSSSSASGEEGRAGLLMSPVQAIILSKLPQPGRAPPAPGEGRRSTGSLGAGTGGATGAGAGAGTGAQEGAGTLLTPEWEALLHDLESAADAWKGGLEGGREAAAAPPVEAAAAPPAPAPAASASAAPVETVEAGTGTGAEQAAAAQEAAQTAGPSSPGRPQASLAAPAAPATAPVTVTVAAGTAAIVTASPFAARVAAAKRGIVSPTPLLPPARALRSAPAYAGATLPSSSSSAVSVAPPPSAPSAPSATGSAPPSVYGGVGEAGSVGGDSGSAAATAAELDLEAADRVAQDGLLSAASSTGSHRLGPGPGLGLGPAALLPATKGGAIAAAGGGEGAVGFTVALFPVTASASGGGGGGLYPHEEAGVWTGRDSPAQEWLDPVPPSRAQATAAMLLGAGNGASDSPGTALEGRRDLIQSVRKGPKAWRSPRSAPTSPLLASPGVLSFTAGSGVEGHGSGGAGALVTSPTAALLSAGSRITRERQAKEAMAREQREEQERARAAHAQAQQEAEDRREQQMEREAAEAYYQQQGLGQQQQQQHAPGRVVLQSPPVEQRLAFTHALHSLQHTQQVQVQSDPRPSLAGHSDEHEHEREREGSGDGEVDVLEAVGREEEDHRRGEGQGQGQGQGGALTAQEPLPSADSYESPSGASRRSLRRAASRRGMAEQGQGQEEKQQAAAAASGVPLAAGATEQEAGGSRRLQEINEEATVPAVDPGNGNRTNKGKKRRFLPSLFWLCTGVTSVEQGPGRTSKAVAHAAHVQQDRARRDSWTYATSPSASMSYSR